MGTVEAEHVQEPLPSSRPLSRIAERPAGIRRGKARVQLRADFTKPAKRSLTGLMQLFKRRSSAWKNWASEQPTDSIFTTFQTIAHRYPKRIALEEGSRIIRYSELRARAVRISNLVLENTRSDSGRIALLFTDRINAIAAILGVLRAGFAFVLLDPDDPEERVRFILKDCAPVALLTDDDHFTRGRKLSVGICSLVHVDQPLISPETESATAVNPRTLAYLFYTSGSTGQPKGVTQTHRNLLHFVRCYSRTLGIYAKDRLTLLYSLSFSAANMDIFGGLLSGATVCVYDSRKTSISQLAAWLRKKKISILHTVPTIFRKLVATGNARDFKSIRAVDLGGETVTAHDVELFRKSFRKNCILINHLAATEASVIAQYIVNREHDYGRDSCIPVGFSAEDVEVKIERNDRTEAGPDEVGQLVISSPFVSPGYWSRPDLNKLAFVDDEQSGWRSFRSKDLGRIGSDGLLYFVGRDDSRIKIRGHTLDIAEVETAIRRCHGVLDVAVVASHSSDPEPVSLVAYLVVTDSTEKESKALRREIGNYVPSYMLPTAFVFVKELPLTASGKIDRKALGKFAQPSVSSAHEKPDASKPFEKEIANIFCEILRQPEISRSADFFLSGGDSMTLPDLQILLSDLVGREVSLKDILADATVSGLAGTLQRLAISKDKGALSKLLLPVRESGRGPILFLVHGILGQAHVGRHLLDLAGDGQRVYALQARGLDGRERPHETVEAMADGYVQALRSAQPSGPYFIVALCAGSFLALQMANILRDAGEEVLPLILIDPPVSPVSNKILTAEIVDVRLKKGTAQGRLKADASSSKRKKAASDTALAISRALKTFKPAPYGGEVYMLVNSRRFTADGWRDPSKQASFFDGHLEIFEVASKHPEIFEVYNEMFAKCFEECVRRVRAQADGRRRYERA